MATIAYLYQAIPEAVILQVENGKTTKEVWEALRKRNVDVERVQKTFLQYLIVEFQMMQMREDESIDTFMVRINTYTTKASELGKSLDERMHVRKLLEFVPTRFIQIVALIEQSTDIDEISIDEVVGKLRSYEEWLRIKNLSPGDGQDNLLYTRHDNNSGRDKRFGNRRQGKFYPSRENWQDRQNPKDMDLSSKPRTNKNWKKFDKSKFKCHKCEKFGHFQRECPQRNVG
ncbi:uncharacterized protein LOC143617412 [Bidens hawaiensis]|uniref:uncharacterized protein LOC143617412 n=1 Tax=Bidens hawaiensis TaxID=980011 RepID=UPI00404928F9